MVAVIAGFNTLNHDSITAAQHDTGIEAFIVVSLVTVIASLITLIANLEVLPTNTVSATGGKTGAGAGVGLHLVAIITPLTGIQSPITADLTTALGVATIACVDVSVITALALVDASVAADFGPAL